MEVPVYEEQVLPAAHVSVTTSETLRTGRGRDKSLLLDEDGSRRHSVASRTEHTARQEASLRQITDLKKTESVRDMIKKHRAESRVPILVRNNSSMRQVNTLFQTPSNVNHSARSSISSRSFITPRERHTAKIAPVISIPVVKHQQGTIMRSGGQTSKKVPASWKEFMTYVLMFMLLCTLLLIPVCIWVFYAFVYGEIATAHSVLIINNALSVSKDGKIGINNFDPQVAVDITSKTDKENTILRLTSRGVSIDELSKVKQTLEFGTYVSDEFIPGVELRHIGQEGKAQLQVSGGDLVVSDDIVISGQVTLIGVVNIGEEGNATSTVDEDGYISLHGNFLSITNSEGAFEVRGDDIVLFRVNADGSFSVEGEFRAGEIDAESQLIGQSFHIESEEEQVSYIRSTGESSTLQLSAPSGFDNKLEFVSNERSFSVGVASNSRLTFWQGDSPILEASDTGIMNVYIPTVQFSGKRDVTQSLISQTDGVEISLEAARGHEAKMEFNVFETSYGIGENANGSFVIERNSEPALVFSENKEMFIYSNSFDFISSSSVDFSVLSLQGDASLTMGTNSDDMSDSSSFTLAHPSSSGASNFTFENKGDGHLVLAADSDVIMRIVPGVSDGRHSVEYTASTFTLSTRFDHTTTIKSESDAASIVIDSFAGSADFILRSGSYDFVLYNSGDSPAAGETAGTLTFSVRHGDNSGWTPVMELVKDSLTKILSSTTSIQGNMTVHGQSTFHGSVVVDNDRYGLEFGTSTTALSRLYLSGDGSLRTDDNFVVDGELVAVELVTVRGDAEVYGDILLTDGKLLFGSDSDSLANLYRKPTDPQVVISDGSWEIRRDISVDGDETIEGSISLDGSFHISEPLSRIVWAEGSEQEVYVNSPTTGVVGTPNSFRIEGDLVVEHDMSVDGIIYASVNVNPGYITTSIGIPTYYSTDTKPVYVSHHPRVRLGKDGKALVIYEFVEEVASESTKMLGVIHCFDAGCGTNRKYQISYTQGGRVIGESPTLEMGPDGYLRVAWVDLTDADTDVYSLKMAKCEATSCEFFDRDSVSVIASKTWASNDSNPFDSISLLLGTDGLMMIIYRDKEMNMLHSIHCSDSGGVCATRDVMTNLTNVGGEANIGYRSSGIPLVVFGRDNNGQLELMGHRCSSSSCELLENNVFLLSQSGASYPAVSLSGDGNPFISFTTSTSVNMVHCSNQDCSGSVNEEALDSVVGRSVSRFGSDGLPAVAYTRSSQESIRFVHCAINSCEEWTVMDVDTSGMSGVDLGEDVDFIVGADGIPFVVYITVADSVYDRDIRVAHCSNRFCVPYARM